MPASSRSFAAMLTVVLLALNSISFGDTHYVSTNGSHQWPYTNWVDAATSLDSHVSFFYYHNTQLDC